MSQRKLPLIVKISSSLNSATFNCRIYSNRQINVYLMSTVTLNLVKFHSGTSTQTSHSAPTCSAIQLLVNTYLNDIRRQNVR